MQALSDAGAESQGRTDRGNDRALVMPPAADRGLLRRMTVLLGVSWGYHKPSQPSRRAPSFLAPRRFAVALAGVAMVVAAMAPAASMASTYSPASDMNSMYNTTLYTGAQTWWSAGYTGAGVDVALIDTGVSQVEGLATPC